MNNNWRQQMEDEQEELYRERYGQVGRNRKRKNLTIVGMAQLGTVICILFYAVYAYLVANGFLHVQGWQ